MDQARLNEILQNHKKWLVNDGSERADLRDAYLRRADLRGADLRGADLRDADLRGANLRYADLRDADLRSANLWRADLRYADLRDADLRGADLRGADLRDANLRDAGLIVIKCPIWTAYVGVETTSIGCQKKTNDQWRNFSDDEIKNMGSNALEWWKIHKPLILAAMDVVVVQKKEEVLA